MAIDAIFISALAEELNNTLKDARIDKIHQPQRDDIVIALRGPFVKGKRLIISANASFPRLHLTERTRENPANAPMFCMLLRKHLTNGKIISVTAPEMERIIDIKLSVNDEMGVATTRTLTCELMGRHSNIILRDSEDRIIECIKRVDIGMSEKRQVLPGLFYTLPPAQEKLNPRSYSRAELFEIICNEKEDIPCDKWIISTFLGFSPLVARELSYIATGDGAKLMGEFGLPERERLATAIFETVNTTKSPCIVFDGKRPYEFSYFPITQYEDTMRLEKRETLSEVLSDFYEIRELREGLRAHAHGILQVVKNSVSRTEKKLALQREELLRAEKREGLREKGELIAANIYRLEKGMTSFVAVNYFDDNKEVEIELDTRLTPQENSEKLFREYRRMKNAEKYITEQINAGEEELIYLESVLESIEKAESTADIAEIREELREMGYVDKNIRRDKKQTALRPYRFTSSDGYTIYAGRNNKQNDALTLKSAEKYDLWFHTKNIPGSHVIVERAYDDEPPARLYTEAAIIAATLSRAKDSKNVPVDYAEVRYVKKPQGAAPGRVIYTNYYTAYVDPDEELVSKLKGNG